VGLQTVLDLRDELDDILAILDGRPPAARHE